MKSIIYLTLLILAFSACQNKETAGTITGYETDSLFLYKATSESIYNLTLLKSIPVTNGAFSVAYDSLELGLYCLSLQNSTPVEPLKDYAFLFLEPVPMKINISRRENNEMLIDASGSDIEKLYATFVEKRLQEKNRLMYDSLENLFNQAREKGDSREMKRTKELSIPFYNKARAKFSELIAGQIEEHEGTYFALYLYHSYIFQGEELNTSDEIAKVRGYVNSFDASCKQTSCYKNIEEKINRFEKCAVGCPAPEITGVDINGNTLCLSDLKGKYVLVDFWSSGCKWCRLEAPNLQKTYRDFKDKGFTILGVSSDYNEEDWAKAIKEDKSVWNQMLLSKKDISPTMDAYCITGIPHILLLDPAGMIVAKQLRGLDIYNTVKENINAAK